ncbi:hypothetical protein KY289_001040 [Solanum tuberosum]|nr:hypothetical protein KY289_001040 [Solanum tuberosum]
MKAEMKELKEGIEFGGLSSLDKYREAKVEVPKPPMFKDVRDAQEVESFLWHLENYVKCNKFKAMTLWHKRLGHTSTSVLSELFATDVTTVRTLNGKSPFAKFYEKDPSLTHKVLGCLYFAKMLNQHDKLLSRDVLFNETVFPSFNEKTTSVPVFKETHSVLDHSTQWSSIPVSSQQSGKYTSTKEGSRITNDITRVEDQHNDLIVDLNGETITVTYTATSENNQPERRSTRGSKPPIWMKEFVSLNIHQDSSYGLQQYMSYDEISNKYSTYIAALSNCVEPKSLNIRKCHFYLEKRTLFSEKYREFSE